MHVVYRLAKTPTSHMGLFTDGTMDDVPRIKCWHPGYRPNPWQDGDGICYDQHCAFASLEQYRDWFRYPEQRARVTMWVLTVSEVTHLGHQSLFRLADVIDHRPATPEEYL